MKKTVITLVLLFFAFGIVACGGGSKDNKYPKLNTFLTDIVKIVKDNKDKPEDAKKLIKELAGKVDKDALKKEGEVFSKSMEEKMKAVKEGDPKDIQGMMAKMTEIFTEELPIMGEIMKMSMDPEYQKIMAELKDLKEMMPTFGR